MIIIEHFSAPKYIFINNTTTTKNRKTKKLGNKSQTKKFMRRKIYLLSLTNKVT